MSDTRHKRPRTTSLDETVLEDRTSRRRVYQRPELSTFDSKTVIEAIGPAHGIYGFVPGTPDGGSL